MQNNKMIKEYIAPVVVLVLICLIITVALSETYQVAEPIIENNSKKTADKTRQEILSSADGFTQYKGEMAVVEKAKVFVSECYVANNKTGIVVTAKSKSFNGLITVMVGIDAKGRITGVKVVDAKDTPGLGTKAQDPKYLEQYKKKTKLENKYIKEDKSVKYITGATISSNAVHGSAVAALKQFEMMGGVK